MADDRYHVKTRSTYYTEDRVGAARKNVEQYDWAAQRAHRAVERADEFIERHGGLAGIWQLVTGQEIPRSASVSGAGSPITGEELIRKIGKREWIGRSSFGPRPSDYPEIDPPPGPWTLVDPTSGYVFPTNDFEAYRESGRDDRGFFDPALADDALLVNERYPDKPDDWGVDDGFGWTDDEGNTFTFVAFFNHFHVWYELRDMARAFREAYLLTGDPTYCRAGSVLLDRIADGYPDLDIGVWGPDAPFGNSHGGTGQGKAIGSIWETRNVQAYLSLYDAIFPGQDGDDGLIETLQSVAAPYRLADKSSIGGIRRNIETRLVGEILPSVKAAQIRGNFGYHQAALAWAAVVADDPAGYSAETLEFLFRDGRKISTDDGSPWGRHEVTGGQVLSHVVDEFDRDGLHSESPNYNQRKPERLATIAEILDGFDAYDGPDLVTHPKIQKMQPALIHQIMCNRYYPHIGDSNGTGDPEVLLPRSIKQAFRWYGDPIYVQALAVEEAANSTRTDDDALIEPDIFDPDPVGFDERVADILEGAGTLDLPSEHFAGYGFAALRDGTINSDAPAEETRREAWIHYGRQMSSHNHADILNLGLFAHGLDILPDLGYPESTGSWPKRRNWTENTSSHNTVMVDRRMQEHQWVGEPHHFAATDRVQLIDVSAPEVYPQTETYRRTTLMLPIDADRSYLVDVFRVEGGSDHLFSFHAAEGPASTEALTLVEQPDGTYAGSDVPAPAHGEDTAYNEAGEQTAHGGPANDGWNYLSNVERDGAPPGTFSVDWDIEDTWDVRGDGAEGVHLRLTMLTAVDEVALADGPPPDKPGNPDSLRYLLARRTGDELATTFTSIIEPYADAPAIASVHAVEVTDSTGKPIPPEIARAVRIELETGRVDYVASATDHERVYLVGDVFRFSGAIATYSVVDGVSEHAYLHRGTELAALDDDVGSLIDEPIPQLDGIVTSFTRELSRENYIDIELSEPPASDLSMLEGKWLYVDTAGDRNGAYRVDGVERRGETEVRIDVGDVTTVRGFVDAKRPEEGYRYLLAVDDDAHIPLSATWRI